MSKRADKKYINKILKIANERYEKACKHELNEKEKIQMQYPHLFVLGCVMDSQIDFERAWEIPFTIAKELKSYELSEFLKKDLAWYKKYFADNKLHRFNDVMAEAFYSALQRIHNKYKDNAKNIWNDKPTSGELICRFLEFDRVGIKIATMAANILTRDYGVEIQDKFAIDISPDIHVKRLMYRLGLIEEIPGLDSFAKIDPTKITFAARSINPAFPGLPDLIFWEIGANKICENNKCHDDKCPFGAFCIKQGLNK